MIIVFLGPPGSGKGTQAAKLSENLKLIPLSTGGIFRESLKSDTELGKEIKSFVESGKLVPDHLVSAVVFEKLKELGRAQKSVILDGYPRTVGQAIALDGFVKKMGLKVDGIVSFTINQDEVVKRLLKRKEIENRADDTEQVIRERLNVYQVQTAPVIGHYSSQSGYLEVNGSQAVDKVFMDLLLGLKQKGIIS